MLNLLCCFGVFIIGTLAQYPAGGGSYGGRSGGYGGAAGYGSGGNTDYGGGGGGGGYGSSGYNQGTGVYFKKPVPIDEKPVFFRTPYWLPNMYYGHYGYPWTEWFDGGPRYVVPIMNAYPHGGGGTQVYGAGYGYGSGNSTIGSYGGGYGSQDDSSATTTPDPYNDGFSYYKGIPIYQTYYEKYLLQKAQSSSATTAASS